MRDIKAIIPAKDKWVSLVWQVNDWCNFRCTYCSEWNWAGRNKNEDDIDLIVTTLERIMLHYKDKGYKYFKLYLSGGEPTFWKAIIPVVEKFRDALYLALPNVPKSEIVWRFQFMVGATSYAISGNGLNKLFATAEVKESLATSKRLLKQRLISFLLGGLRSPINFLQRQS